MKGMEESQFDGRLSGQNPHIALQLLDIHGIRIHKYARAEPTS